MFFRQLLSSTWYSVMVLETWGYCGEVGGLERINKSQPPNIIYTEEDPKMNNFLGKCFPLWLKYSRFSTLAAQNPNSQFPIPFPFTQQQKIAGQNLKVWKSWHAFVFVSWAPIKVISVYLARIFLSPFMLVLLSAKFGDKQKVTISKLKWVQKSTFVKYLRTSSSFVSGNQY